MPSADAVPILTYHALDRSRSVISVDPDDFRRHVASLQERAFTVLTLRELASAWGAGAPLPPRPVVLTFDDGFASVVEHAAPVLAAAGYGATVFVVAGHVGGRNDWASQPTDVPRAALLGKDDLRALAGAGWEIGSHGFTHEPLPRLTPEAARHEIEGSRRALEDAVGAPVTSFAYPYGKSTARDRQLAAGAYACAVGVELRVATTEDERHDLPRVDVYYLRRPSSFARLGTPLGRAYLALRAVGRRVRAVGGP